MSDNAELWKTVQRLSEMVATLSKTVEEQGKGLHLAAQALDANDKRIGAVMKSFEGLPDAVGSYVSRSLKPVAERLVALERRPAGLVYRGIWSQGAENEPGDVCTFDGSMWCCVAKTFDRPGSSPDWVLSVKRGRDGR